MGDRVSLREFARRLGHNPGYIHKLKALGKLVMVPGEKGRDLVDVDASLLLLAASKDPSRDYMEEVNAKQRQAHRGEEAAKAEPPAKPVDVEQVSQNASFLKAKTDEQVYAAKLRELEYQKATGEYIVKADVERAWANRMIRFREAFSTLSYRLSHMLAAESDPIVVQRIMYEEIKATLDDLSVRRASKRLA